MDKREETYERMGKWGKGCWGRAAAKARSGLVAAERGWDRLASARSGVEERLRVGRLRGRDAFGARAFIAACGFNFLIIFFYYFL